MRAFGSGCALSCSVLNPQPFKEGRGWAGDAMCPILHLPLVQSETPAHERSAVSGQTISWPCLRSCQYMSIHDLCLTSCYFSPIHANIVSDWTRIWGAQWCGCEHFLSYNFRAKAVAVNSHSSHSMIGYSMLQCSVTVYNCYSSDWFQQTTARYCKSRPFLGSCLVQTFCWREFMCRCAG